MIKNLIFDFGKVLVDYDFDHTVADFFASGEDCSEFLSILSDPAFVHRCDLELIPFDELVKEMQDKYPQYSRQFQLFHDRYIEFMLGEIDGMYDYLQNLKGRGYRLFGLSNWGTTVLQVIEKYPIFKLLDGSVISYQLKITKPDPEIYQALLEKYDLKAEECVFADDRLENVEGARRVGMEAILFADKEQYERELEEMLER